MQLWKSCLIKANLKLRIVAYGETHAWVSSYPHHSYIATHPNKTQAQLPHCIMAILLLHLPSSAQALAALGLARPSRLPLDEPPAASEHRVSLLGLLALRAIWCILCPGADDPVLAQHAPVLFVMQTAHRMC